MYWKGIQPKRYDRKIHNAKERFFLVMGLSNELLISWHYLNNFMVHYYISSAINGIWGV